MKRFAPVTLLALVCLTLIAAAPLPPDSVFTPPTIPQPKFDESKQYNVKDFGATGDGSTNDTAAVSKTIEIGQDFGYIINNYY